MEAEYRRDYNQNYLILHEKTELDLESYPIRMLLANTIPCLLPCRQQSIDGEAYFYFDITSKQAFSAYYEKQKLKKEDLELLFSGIVRAMEQLSNFLMNPDQLCLEPEYLYLDLEKKQLYFCYFPSRDKKFQEQFQSLVEYLLPKIEHEDAHAVRIGYGIYHKVIENGFQTEEILQELYAENPEREAEIKKNRRENQKENLEPEIFPEENQLFEEKSEAVFGKIEDWKSEDEEKPKKQKQILNVQIGVIGFFALITVALVGLSVARGKGYFSEWNIQTMIGGIFLLASLTIFLTFLFEKQKKKKEEPILPLKSNSFEKSAEARAEEMEEKEGRTVILSQMPVQTLGQFSIQSQKEAVKYPIGVTEDLIRPPVKIDPTLKNINPGDQEDIILKENLTIIGKLPTAADILIPLSTVSRIHAKIQKREGHCYLIDLNSKNGTYVNGELLEREKEQELKDQDEVKFGEAIYIFSENHT